MSRPVRKVRHVPRSMTRGEAAAALAWAFSAAVAGGACIWGFLKLLGI